MLALDTLGSIRSFIRRCENTSSIDELEDVIETALRHIGVAMFAYIYLPPYGTTDTKPCRIKMHFGTSKSLRTFYESHDFYGGQPATSIRENRTHPFWSSASFRSKTSACGRLLGSMPQALGLGRVLILPVLSENLDRAYFVMRFQDPDKFLTNVQISMFQSALQGAHYKYVDALEAITKPNTNLTERELDVLKWTALGKSDPVIADILATTPERLNTHMRNISKKLDVTDRARASLKGIALGLI